MPKIRKLGRPTDQKEALLRGQVTSLLLHGKITTTEARAAEVQKVAEKFITLAIKEADNFTSKQITVSKPKLDGKGQKITVSKTSKNGNVYDVVEREKTTEMVKVDNPSRLHARRQVMKYVYKLNDEKGNSVNVVSKLFDEIAPKYKNDSKRTGGYTRTFKLGPRRGDAAEMVIIELI